MTLTEFLLARIAEDEAVARAATTGAWMFETAPNGFPPMVTGGGMVVADTYDKPHLSDAAHIARHGPARVLAECEAKRAILFEHELDGTCLELLALARVYSDHPDFRGEWR